MDKRLPRFQKLTLFLSAATLTLFSLPALTHAQSTAAQDKPAVQSQDRQAVQTDDLTRRDLARFDQFLDSHRDIADRLRRTPSLIDDPQFLQSHPELSAYLQDHPSVKQEITQQPGTFMRLEDSWAHDANQRDRDAGGQGRDADRGGFDRGPDRRNVANFDRFLDDHREIAEQVRKDPSVLNNQDFVRNHPALQTYFQDNPGVRDQSRQDPNAFMRQEDAYDRDTNFRDRNAGGQDRDAFGRNVTNFDRFLDGHREIAEQVRKDPSLLDNRDFVRNHPALQSYFQDNPGVRDQLRQDPNGFMHQEDAFDRDSNPRGRDPMQDHMADFGGFLRNHSDIQKDVQRDPSCVKDHEYLQNHTELDAYLNAHPEVRTDLMANPQSFVHGAQQYNNPSATGTSSGTGVNVRGTGTTGGAGMNPRGTGTTGSMAGSSAGTSANPPTQTHNPKPNQ